MSRVQNMAQARDNISVKYHEFMRICATNKTPIVFEGEDEKYYSIRIDNLTNFNWVGINCGGKSKVLSLRNKIRNSEAYANKQVLFFIDADFDANTEAKTFSDVYITPCYSIENLYISDSCFIKILRSEFGISEADEDTTCYSKVLQLFNSKKAEFLNLITDFNILIHHIRALEANGQLNTRLNINNIEIDQLIHISLKELKQIYSIEKYIDLFPELPEDLNLDLNLSRLHFNDKEHEITFRGKQNLDFLRSLLILLRQDRGKKTDREVFTSKGKVKIQLTKGNTLSELSQYADTPDCLKNFLSQNNLNH